MLRVLIYGSCVSRDTVEHMPDVKVARYIARQSLISATSPARRMPDAPFPSSFQRRMAADDFASTALAEVAATEADVVVVDLVDERLGVVELDGSWVTRSQEFRESVAPHVMTGRVLPFGSDEHFARWSAAVPGLVAALAGRPVLVLEAPFARMDNTGQPAPRFEQVAPDVWDARFARYYDTLRAAGLPFHRINNPVTDTAHRWGPAAYHYTRPVYEAAGAAIRQVASQAWQP